METPLTYVWSRHALRRLAERGVTQAQVEALLANNWGARQPNVGAGKWRIAAEGIVVVFDSPVDGDHGTVLIRTVWAS